MKRLTRDIEILRLAKKKRRVIIREADYWACESLVKRGLLDKSIPSNRKAAGWPEYRLSRKGKKYVESSNG